MDLVLSFERIGNVDTKRYQTYPYNHLQASEFMFIKYLHFSVN